MASPPFRRGSSSYHETLDFIETAQYDPPSTVRTNQPLPRGWRQFQHPNGDIYYYHSNLRLTTPDNIREPAILQRVIDTRDRHLQGMENDSSIQRLPADLEIVVSDCATRTVVVRLYSRAHGQGYYWVEEEGLILMTREEYWSHVAEFPSHHRELPPNSEAEFIQSLHDAIESLARGAVFPFNERQIDLIVARYHSLRVGRTQGRNVTPSLGWLIGAVMPLEPVLRPRRMPTEEQVMDERFLLGL